MHKSHTSKLFEFLKRKSLNLYFTKHDNVTVTGDMAAANHLERLMQPYQGTNMFPRK